jgi:hypothetical protein
VQREIDHRQLLLAPETVMPLPSIHDAEALGIHAIAKIKLATPDSLFTAYLAGFDGDDTFFGLICAREIYIGQLYFSGLTVAWKLWGIPIQHDKQFKPTSLEQLAKDCGIGSKPRPNVIVPFYDIPRGIIQSRLAGNLAKEPHHFYNSKYQRGRY